MNRRMRKNHIRRLLVFNLVLAMVTGSVPVLAAPEAEAESTLQPQQTEQEIQPEQIEQEIQPEQTVSGSETVSAEEMPGPAESVSGEDHLPEEEPAAEETADGEPVGEEPVAGEISEDEIPQEEPQMPEAEEPAGTTLNNVSYIDENGDGQTADNVTVLSASDTSWTTGWYTINSDLTIGSRATVTGDVKLILSDNCTLTIPKGITVSDNNSLTIYAQSTGDHAGKLVINGVDDKNSGIGGAAGQDCGIITINGGIVTAEAGYNAMGQSGGAGIGGGMNGAGGNITINEGMVSARGGSGGAGIGGGSGRNGGTITISGGTVSAEGNASSYGAGGGSGIGGGYTGSGGTITITGGTVSSSGKRGGAGIGGGDSGPGGNITITGGSVIAVVIAEQVGGGAGIGGGHEGSCGTITITGGTVSASSNSGAGIGCGSHLFSGTAVITITGGTVSAYSVTGVGIGNDGYYLSTTTLSWTDKTDSIFASSYGGAVTVSQNRGFHIDGTDDYIFAGRVTDLSRINNKKLVPCTGADVPYIEADGTAKTAHDVTMLKNTDTIWTAGWYSLSSDLTIGSRATVTGDVKLILSDNRTLTIPKGISVLSGNSLTIYGQTGQSGKLISGVDGRIETNNAGIGGGHNESVGNITIVGGNIIANGSINGAGIGGGFYSSTGTIKITGGNIIAKGGNSGAGIGGGFRGSVDLIRITGGNIIAKGGESGAGIGGGNATDLRAVTITGGTVSANSGICGAGIGGGSSGSVGTIMITGGTVLASGDDFGTGIGGGFSGLVRAITITGGTVSSTGGNNGVGIGAANGEKRIILSWTGQTDSIFASNYRGTVTVSADKTFMIDGTQEYIGEGEVTDLSLINNKKLIPAGEVDADYVDADGTAGTAHNVKIVRSTDTSWSSGWYTMKSSVSVNNRVTVSGDVKLILSDGFTLTVPKGITVSGDNSLTIYGQAGQTGELISGVAGQIENLKAGIGGEYNLSGGNITINGGSLSVNGGDDASGIGGGCYGSGGNITINGGSVSVNGGVNAAGIGGGGGAPGVSANESITINNGTVTVIGGKTSGAGIGGGYTAAGAEDGGTITINGGTVLSLAGERGSAGIGGGWNGGPGAVNGGIIKITGGIVSANGTDGGAGIGGGEEAPGVKDHGSIRIEGGTVYAAGSGGYDSGAGIGGGGSVGYSVCAGADNGIIAITGGTVFADGGLEAAGIGGGGSSSGSYNTDICAGAVNGGEILIDGGTVFADGGLEAAGIGGGNGSPGAGDNSFIMIKSGTVSANGGWLGAGIGGGYSGAGSKNSGSITISGGTVSANGGEDGAGIGAGASVHQYGGNIFIYGGTVSANGGGDAAGIGDDPSNVASCTTVLLGWTDETDSIYASSYSAIVTVSAGKAFRIVGTADSVSSGVVADLGRINGRKLVPVVIRDIAVAPFVHGSVRVSKNRAVSGESILVTVSADRSYRLESLTVKKTGGTETVYTAVSGNEHTFIMPDYAVTVTASFISNGTVTIIRQPGDIELLEGYTGENVLSFRLSDVEGYDYSYLWHTNTSKKYDGGISVNGAVSSDYALPLGLTEGRYYYYCTGTVTNGTDTDVILSSIATVTVSKNAPPEPPAPEPEEAWGEIPSEIWADIFDSSSANFIAKGYENRVWTAFYYGGKWHDDTDDMRMEYTGKKISLGAGIRVFQGYWALRPARDYVISYRHNKNAASRDAVNAPSIRISAGKKGGRYTGSRVFRFDIVAADIGKAHTDKSGIVAAKNGTRLSRIRPVVSYAGSRLSEGRDYEVLYYEGDTIDASKLIASPRSHEIPKGGRTYLVSLKGKGNFAKESRAFLISSYDKNDRNVLLMKNARITDEKGRDLKLRKDYDGDAFDVQGWFDNRDGKTPKARVMIGKKVLAYGEDYTVSAVSGDDLKAAGKHSLVFEGTEKTVSQADAKTCIGTRTFALNVTGKRLKNAKIAGLRSVVGYQGRDIEISDLFNKNDRRLEEGWNGVSVYVRGADGKKIRLTESTDGGVSGDYIVYMSNRGSASWVVVRYYDLFIKDPKNCTYDEDTYTIEQIRREIERGGSFSLIFCGINGYTGTIRRSVLVRPYDIGEKKTAQSGRKITVSVCDAVYRTGGTKPEVTVLFENRALREGIDYVLSYRNNRRIAEDLSSLKNSRKPAVIVKGIGNYTGFRGGNFFAIRKADVGKAAQMSAEDVSYRAKGWDGYFLKMPVLKDNGRKLSSDSGQDTAKLSKKDIDYTYVEEVRLEDGTVKAAGSKAEAKDRVPAGTVIRASAYVRCGKKSGYAGDEPAGTLMSCTYKVIGKSMDIGNSKAVLTEEGRKKLAFNNGYSLTVSASDIKVTLDGKDLDPASDYEAVSVTDSRFPGSTAVIVIRGTGAYGGKKKIRCKVGRGEL